MKRIVHQFLRHRNRFLTFLRRAPFCVPLILSISACGARNKTTSKWRRNGRQTTNEKFLKRFALNSQDTYQSTWTPHGPLGSPTLNAVNIVIICFYVYKCSFPVMFIFIATCLNVNNCTSPIHGACKTTDVCQCNPGYIGNKKFILLFFGFFV